MRLQFRKRSATVLVSRIIPVTKCIGINDTIIRNKVHQNVQVNETKALETERTETLDRINETQILQE